MSVGMNREELLFILRMRDEASRVLKHHGEELKRTGQEANRAKVNMQELHRAILEVVGAIGAILTQTMVLRQTFGVFADYEQGMIAVQKTTDLSASEMSRFQVVFDEMASRLPIPIAQLQEIAAVSGQLGIQGVDNILTFTEVIAKMGTATDLVGEEAATSLARMLNVFGESPQDVERLGSVLVALGNNSAATEREIARMATEISLATSVFKIGTTEASAIGAAMAELGLRAELSGTSVGRTFRALDKAAREGGDGMRVLSQLTGQTQEQFRRLVESNPQAAFDLFISSLGRVIQAGGNYYPILEALSLQQEEINKTIIPLAANYERLAEKQRLAREEAEQLSALNREFDQFSTSIISRLRVLMNSFDLLGKSIGEDVAPTFVVAIEGMTNAIRALTEAYLGLPEPVQDVIAHTITLMPTVVALGMAFSALRRVLVLLRPTLGLMVGAFGSVAIGIASVGAVLYVLTEMADQIQITSTGVATLADYSAVAWEAIMDHVNQAVDVILPILERLADFFGVMFDGAVEAASDVFAHLISIVVNVVNAIIGSFVGAYNSITEVWGRLPGVFRDIGAQAANWFIDGIEGMVNAGVAGIRILIEAINDLMSFIGADQAAEWFGFSGQFSLPEDIDLSNWKFTVTGAAREAGQIIQDEFEDAFSRDYLAEFGEVVQQRLSPILAEWTRRAEERARARLGDPPTEASRGEALTLSVPDFQPLEIPELGTTSSGKGRKERDLTKERENFFRDLEYEIELLHQEAGALEAGAYAYAEWKKAREIESQVERFLETAEGLGIEKDAVEALIQSYREAAVAKQDAAEKAEEITTASREVAQTVTGTFKDIIFSAKSVDNAMGDLLKRLAEIILQATIFGPLEQAITKSLGSSGGLFSWFFSAKGNAFGNGDIIPMASGGTGSGGILRQPTFFPMRSGNVAVGGELDDEAIMPLRRLPNGDLGVQALGGGGGSTVIQVNTSINVEGGSRGQEADRDLANRIGREVEEAVNAAVMKNLRQQMRPGNMLNPLMSMR